MVGMSKAIMNNELKWLETGVTDYVAAAKVRDVPEKGKNNPNSQSQAIFGK